MTAVNRSSTSGGSATCRTSPTPCRTSTASSASRHTASPPVFAPASARSVARPRPSTWASSCSSPSSSAPSSLSTSTGTSPAPPRAWSARSRPATPRSNDLPKPAGPRSRFAPRSLRPGPGALFRAPPRVVSLMQVQIAEQIRADVNSAMKAGDRDRAAALRLVLSELQKDAKEGAGDELPLLPRARHRPRARGEAEGADGEAGRGDLADAEAYEAAAIEAYLPAELSDAELDALVASAVAETGAEGPRDMGRAIKHVMAAAGGRADGRRVSGKVKEALSA